MENSSRLDRFQGRAALRLVTNNSRCGDCGRRSVLPGGNVQMRRSDDGIVGYAGLLSCGSVWLCPVCNARIMARRAIDIGAVLVWANSQGLQVIWGSLTVWHNRYSDLGQMLDLQTRAWRRMTQRKAWTNWSAVQRVAHVHTDLPGSRCAWVCAFEHADKADCSPGNGCEYHCQRTYDYRQKTVAGELALGRVGHIRAAEINIGDVNGWHPHFHPIIFFRGTKQEAQWYADDIVKTWVDAVESLGGIANRQGGQQLTVVEGVEIFDALTGYVTKATYEPAKLAIEAVWSQGKKGRGRVKETRSHWSLLAAIALGLADDVALWLDLEKATENRRAVTWSLGLRDFAGLYLEETDEEISGEEVGTKEDTVCVITARGWLSVCDNPEVMALLLDALDLGWSQLALALDFYGIEYATADDLSDIGNSVQAGFAETARIREVIEYEENKKRGTAGF